MKKVKLYYPNYTVDITISKNDHTLLLRKWNDRSNRGESMTIITKHHTQFDIDLTKVELIESSDEL